MNAHDEKTLGGNSRMPAIARRWQARIEIGEESWGEVYYQTTYVYGETIDKLRVAARMYLRERNPHHFNNGGDYIVGRTIYFYSVKGIEYEFEPKDLAEGWWYREESMDRDNMNQLPFQPPEQLRNFEGAVEHFVTCTIIPEKGPDYRSKAIVGENFRLPLLEKVLREDEEYPINDLIQRGWHIIGLEYKGEPSITGELMNRKAIFVMGHPEVQAANMTLNTNYYKDIRIGSG
jgi:hypothetical protein